MAVELAFKKYIKEFKEDCLKDPTNSGPLAHTCKCISEYDSKVSRPASTGGFISMFHKSPAAFYLEMSEYFGDSLTLKFPEILELKTQVFTGSVREVKTSILDPEENKSGEELLEELVEQVKQEENVKKQEDMKRQQRVKQELEEKNEWWKREKDMRLADHRRQLHRVQQNKDPDVTADVDNNIEVVHVGDKSIYMSSIEDSSGLAVTSAIGAAPGQGIKLTFTKKSKITPSGAFLDSPISDFTEIKEREVSSRKRKPNSLSPDKVELYPGSSRNSRSGMFYSEADSYKASPSKLRKEDGGF